MPVNSVNWNVRLYEWVPDDKKNNGGNKGVKSENSVLIKPSWCRYLCVETCLDNKTETKW